jgi:hypothetical protein
MIGFGLDLAGYTQKKTSLAAIIPQGMAAHVTLLRGSALCDMPSLILLWAIGCSKPIRRRSGRSSTSFPGLYKAKGKERIKEQRAACSALCERLSIVPPLYNDDDIDALICAVISVAPATDLWGPDDYKIKSADLPRGYRLLKRNPFKEICQTAAAFPEWISSREKS